MSLYARIIAFLLSCLACTGLGWRLGIDHMKASRADIDAAIQRTQEAAEQGAAKAIAGLQIKHQTIIQKAEHEIKANPAMSDCHIGASALGLLNAAAGYGEPEPAGGGDVSASAVAP